MVKDFTERTQTRRNVFFKTGIELLILDFGNDSNTDSIGNSVQISKTSTAV